MKKMLIIDGNSILNRAYYGIRPLTNKNGLYTHAVYGMVNIILKHVEALSPDYCIVAFDLKAPTFRHKMFTDYKANRKGMPEELAVQVPYAKKCMRDLGFRVMTCEGFEADDILGTMASVASDAGVHAYILTGDRDSLQLIGDNISVLLVKTKETLEYTREVFYENYGVYPEAFVDVKALMGDTSDNIPGVAGIGEKTALKLISDFGSLDALYENFESAGLSASLVQKLANGREMAYISRDLARINTDAPIDRDLSAAEYNGPDKAALYSLFTELEFFALIKKIGLEGEKDHAEFLSDHITKTVGEKLDGKIVLYMDGDVLYGFDGENSFSLDISDASADGIKKMLDGRSVVCHDFKTIYKRLYALGVNGLECAFDTMLAAYVLNSNRNKYTLEDVLNMYVAGADGDNVKNVYSLYSRLCPLVSEQDCEKLLYEIEIPLSRVLAHMELVGFKVDVDGIASYGRELSEMAEALKERIYSLAGEEFNINSPKQLGVILFEKMGLPAGKKTKTGYSTDADTLQKLMTKHPIVEDILDYRQLTKLNSTYAEGLAHAADESGRIHTVFSQTGTATGRLSSAEPNLQNIPVRTELGRHFRRYFVPESDDYVIIDADYSQIELRLLAHISGDDAMREIFSEGLDIHTMTASAVFGVDPDMVTPELRKRAKAVNFGIVYGIGEHSLSEDLKISYAEAKRYIQSYLAGFPKVSEYLEGIKRTAREQGYVTTEFGRKRYIPELTSANKNMQHFGERVAMNSPIQGTSADIIKIAMIKVSERLESEGLCAHLILQVHDELLIEAHRDCAERAKEILVECMESAVDFSVPLLVEANIGKNWFEAK